MILIEYEIVNSWKKNIEMKIFYVATRGKSILMDSKINFEKNGKFNIYQNHIYIIMKLKMKR